MFPNGFNKIIIHYAKNNGAPLLYSDVLDIVGSTNYAENISFMEEKDIGKITVLTKENCPQCSLSATVKNAEEGVIVCGNSHMNRINPLKLTLVEIDNTKLVDLLFNSLQNVLKELKPVTDSQYTPYHFCGFDPIGILQMGEIKIMVLSSFKRIKLRDAAILQGLITTSIIDCFILLIEGIEKDAEEFLIYNTGEAIHYISFNDLLKHDGNISQLFKDVQSTININTLALHTFLKHNLTNIRNIANPETFKSLLEYDATLVDRSSKAATSGSSEEFEDIVGKLLGAFMPVTNLGHTISSQSEGKKIEAPDGIIEIPEKNSLELMFYDCKSVGTETKEKEIKSISQSDEDQFERYCKLFDLPKIKPKLTRGIFVANDFSLTNLANKSLQIRKKTGVPADLQIVYFPLKSLIKLYSRLTQERSKYMMYFETHAISKLFGQGITGDDNEKLKSDENFNIFDTLRKSNTNSVYIIDGLVDLFFDHVYSLVPRNQIYLPYIIDISKRQSVRY